MCICMYVGMCVCRYVFVYVCVCIPLIAASVHLTFVCITLVPFDPLFVRWRQRAVCGIAWACPREAAALTQRGTRERHHHQALRQRHLRAPPDEVSGNEFNEAPMQPRATKTCPSRCHSRNNGRLVNCHLDKCRSLHTVLVSKVHTQWSGWGKLATRVPAHNICSEH